MTITYPDLKEFKDATSSIYDSFADTYNKELLDMIRNI